MSNNTEQNIIPTADLSPQAAPARTRKAQRDAAENFINTVSGVSFPNSQRIYLQGSRDDIQVPMREIQLSQTLIGGDKDNPQFEDNEPVPIYDTSGPYGDPVSELNVHKGLKKFVRHG